MNAYFYPGRSREVRYLLLGSSLLLASIACPALASAADQMPSPKPDAALIGTHERDMTLEIKFAADGHVTRCHAISSSGSPALDKQTAAFIVKNWNCPSMAGQTVHVPIDFHPPPKVAAQPAPDQPASTSTSQNMPSNLGGGYGSGGGGGTGGSMGRGAAP